MLVQTRHLTHFNSTKLLMNPVKVFVFNVLAYENSFTNSPLEMRFAPSVTAESVGSWVELGDGR